MLDVDELKEITDQIDKELDKAERSMAILFVLGCVIGYLAGVYS